MIPHNRPTIGKEEEEAVIRVLHSGWLSEGNEVKNFEIQLGPRNFSYWSVDANAWQIKGGAYKILIGSSSKDIYLETTINLEQALEVLQ